MIYTIPFRNNSILGSESYIYGVKSKFFTIYPIQNPHPFLRLFGNLTKC